MSEIRNEKEQRSILERKWAATFSVPESHAKAIMRLGAFQRFEMSWKDHEFDDEWNVIDVPQAGEGRGIIGGLHRKIPGIEKIFVYRFGWPDIKLGQDGKDTVQFNEKILDYIFLKPTYYAFRVEKAETSPQADERIPVTLHVSVLLRVVNPYKTLFNGVPNWFDNAAARLTSMMRDWVAKKKLDEVLSFRRNPDATWLEFANNPIIESLEKDWGIRVEKKGLDIRAVDLPKEYEEAAAMKKKLELEAEARRTRTEIESQARASEVVGTMIQMIHQNTGMSIRKIRKELRDDAAGFFKKYGSILEKNYELLANKIAIEGGSYVKIDVEGAEGVERALLNIITAWQRMPQGKSLREDGKESKERTKKTEEEEESQNSEDVDGAKRKKRKTIPEEDVAKRYAKYKKQ